MTESQMVEEMSDRLIVLRASADMKFIYLKCIVMRRTCLLLVWILGMMCLLGLGVGYDENLGYFDLDTLHGAYVGTFNVLECALSYMIYACFKCVVMKKTCLRISYLDT